MYESETVTTKLTQNLSSPNIKRRNKENKYSQIAQIKMMLYGVFVYILSLVNFPSSSFSSSILEDVSPDLFDANDGYFTSNIDLQKLLSTEEAIMFELEEYVRNEEKRIVKLKGYLNEYQKIRTEAASDVERYVGNPLNSYLLIKRLTSDWKEVKELVSVKTGEAVISHLTNRTEERALRWPSEEDLNGAAVALTRLQDTYNLRPGDISQGRLSGVSYNTHLTANDCFELGRQPYNNGDHAHTVQWMNEAIKKWRQEPQETKTVKKSDILEYLAFSYYSQEDLKKALYYTNQLLELVPEHPRAVGNKWYYEETLAAEGKLDDELELSKRKGDDGSEDFEEPELVMDEIEDEPLTAWDREHQAYQKLCRGEGQVPISVKSKMYCYYSHGHSAYLKIIPYKVETVSLNPRVDLYHEVLSDYEIDVIKELATPRFKRATVQNYKSGNLETASYRISKTAWLRRDEDEAI